MVQGWNGTERAKPKYSKRNLYQFLCVYHKSYMKWFEIENSVRSRHITAWATTPPEIIILKCVLKNKVNHNRAAGGYF
jgi:hypothetical protein